MDRYNVRPGLLVALKTHLKGGVSYQTTDMGRTENGETVCTRWETEKTVTDAAELERATVARNRASSLIRGACIPTPFGLVCPTDREAALLSACDRARAAVADHNATANYTRAEVFVIIGRIAANDGDAARAILGDVRDALELMRAGIRDMDPDAIRDAASRARSIGRMLDETQGDRVTEAIKAARKAAREIAKATEDGAANVEAFRLKTNTEPLDALRFAFLDIDDPAAVKPAGDGPADAPTGFETFPDPEPEAPAVDVQRFAGLEVETEEVPADAV